MKDEKWNQKYNEKLKKLGEAGHLDPIRMLQFGRYVRSFRLAIPGLSQSKAAKLARISRSQWARMEAGKHRPRPYNIAGIADAIRVPPNALYRKAGYEIPEKYMRYDLKPAAKDFTNALKECFTFQEFIVRMQWIWQQYKRDVLKRPVKDEEQSRKYQGMYIDYDLAELLQHIHKVMNAPQRIKLARELVKSSDPKTIRATLPDAKDFLEELEQKVELLKGNTGHL